MTEYGKKRFRELSDKYQYKNQSINYKIKKWIFIYV
jgi:hypothetical protein